MPITSQQVLRVNAHRRSYTTSSLAKLSASIGIFSRILHGLGIMNLLCGKYFKDGFSDIEKGASV